MSNEIDKYTDDPYVQQRLQDVDVSMDRLLSAAEQDRAVIKESVFKRTLLPVLTNRSGRQSLRIWQDIAGHPMRAIEVVSDTKGETLFIIPPLLKGILPDIPYKQKRMSVYEILRVAEQKRQVISGMGENFLLEQMREWKPEGSDGDSTIRQWASILQRYNIDIGVKPAEAEVTTTEKENDIDLTGEYDDL